MLFFPLTPSSIFYGMKTSILAYALTGLATLVQESIARPRTLRSSQDEQEPPGRLSTTKKYIVEVEPVCCCDPFNMVMV